MSNPSQDIPARFVAAYAFLIAATALILCVFAGVEIARLRRLTRPSLVTFPQSERAASEDAAPEADGAA